MINKTKKIISLLSVSILTACLSNETDSNNSTSQVSPENPPPVIQTPAPEIQSPDPGHSANNSLDWNGTYKGKFPCADCEAINIKLTINTNSQYILEESYIGKKNADFQTTGKFSWNKAGNTITLINQTPPNQFFVGENVLIKLDINGNKPTGALASKYFLFK